MMRAIKTRFLFLPALLLALPLALAQAPSGLVSFAFDRSTFPLWDFTGPYQFDQQMTGVGAISTLSVPVFITHDLAGRLRGAGTTVITLGQDVVSANYVLNGSVSLGGNATRVIFSLVLSGSGLDPIAGQRRAFKISLSYNLVVDPDPTHPPAWIPPARGIPVRGTVGVSGLGLARVSPGDNFAVALPAGVDGHWSVNMNLLPLQRLGGTAAIVVHQTAPPGGGLNEPGRRVLNANIVGAFKPTLAISQVLLTGLFDSRPASLQLTFFNGATEPARMSGRILGQTIRQ